MELVENLLDVFRPKRWYRNIAMVLGSVIAVKLLNISFAELSSKNIIEHFILALAGICLVSSANYGLNEVLDAQMDKHHPQKKNRAIPSGRVSPKLVITLSILWYVLGLVLVGLTRDVGLIVSTSLLIISGFIYNVRPLRLKDRPYLDFTSEALNNPIRLMVGWYAVADGMRIVPVSFIFIYWFMGIFLMAGKRFAELRLINNKVKAKKYRISLGHYSEEYLLMSMIAAVTAFSYMLGVESLKYSVDVVLALPFVVVWVVWFFYLAFEKDSIVVSPERILEKKLFSAFSVLTLTVFLFLFFSGNSFLGVLQ